MKSPKTNRVDPDRWRMPLDLGIVLVIALISVLAKLALWIGNWLRAH